MGVEEEREGGEGREKGEEGEKGRDREREEQVTHNIRNRLNPVM